MRPKALIVLRIATAVAVAFVVFSCKNKPESANEMDFSSKPAQRMTEMFAVQTDNGVVSTRMEAPVMERYFTDSTSEEYFPEGFYVYSYNAEGLLETLIMSDEARHIDYKRRNDEVWQAFGHVVVHNVPEIQTMETDTIYWDRAHNEIYSNCYVKMYSSSGFLQGKGMRSKDDGTEAELFEPFDGYGYTTQDTTAVILDSINFIGPFLGK